MENYRCWALLLEILFAMKNYVYAFTPCTIVNQGISRAFKDMGQIPSDIFVTEVLRRPRATFEEKSGSFSVLGGDARMAWRVMIHSLVICYEIRKQ